MFTNLRTSWRVQRIRYLTSISLKNACGAMYGAKYRKRKYRKSIPTTKKIWRSSHFVCVLRRSIITAGSRNDSWDYTEDVGGLIGGSTWEIIIKRWFSRMRNRLDDLNENVVQKRPATRDASRISTFTSHEKESL